MSCDYNYDQVSNKARKGIRDVFFKKLKASVYILVNLALLIDKTSVSYN